MSPRSSPTLRRALAAGVVALVVGVVGPASRPAAGQDVPAPSTEPATTTAEGGDGTSTTAADETDADDGDEAAVDAAQDQADADLRSVWVIVAALGAVALGLLVLLVLYVRATNPERAARRRAEMAAGAGRPGPGGGEDVDGPAATVTDRAGEPGRRRDVDRDGDRVAATADAAEVGADADVVAVAPVSIDKAAPVAASSAATPTTVLSRDPEGAADEGVTVLGGAVPGPKPGEPVRPEVTSPPVTTGSGAGTRRRPRPSARPPAGPRPAPAGPPPGPAEGDETVRIVPAPSGPSAVPTSAGRGAVVASAAGDPPDDDRRPPRALVDAPSPRRPRRVDAPAKKLGTPDAERVLVRPGQAPVRVPPSMARPGDGGDAKAETPEGDAAGEPDEPGAAGVDDDR